MRTLLTNDRITQKISVHHHCITSEEGCCINVWLMQLFGWLYSSAVVKKSTSRLLDLYQSIHRCLREPLHKLTD